jgi:hypothetical protein
VFGWGCVEPSRSPLASPKNGPAEGVRLHGRRPYDRRHRPITHGEDAMSQTDDWSPDEPSGTEPFEQGDEAFDDQTQLDSEFLESVELDPSLDPTLQVDDRELEEAGAVFDDPEAMVTLDGGIDDPDGLGETSQRRHTQAADDEGWDLDAPEVVGGDEPDPGVDEN